MADTLEAPVLTAAPEEIERGPRLLTIEEYEAIPDSVFPEGTRFELIEGLIYEKMSQNDPHITAIAAVQAALQQAFGGEIHLRVQGPLKLGTRSAPEPDVTVLRGTWRDYDGRRPDPLTDVPLVVEVSDTTLAEDQGRKARLYAKHGISEYWIVNLQGRTLEVRRGPRVEAEDWFETLVYREGETAMANGKPVAVADLLPKP